MYYAVLIVISLIMAWVLQEVFSDKEVPYGYWNRLIGALIGAWVGDLLLGDWAWMPGGYNVIAGIIGSFIIGWIYILLINRFTSAETSE